jgi:hypothetical protein
LRKKAYDSDLIDAPRVRPSPARKFVLPVLCGWLGWLMLTVFANANLAMAQISPGALSRAHQSLDGATDCTSCHKLSTGKAGFQCLECHGEINSRLSAHKGFHASLGIIAGSSQECVTCHSEHNGEDFPLIKWDTKSFDHKKTGYILEGKHAGLTCEKCHNQQRIASNQLPTIKVKDLNRTFLGVSPSCATCHQDAHKGRLGADCLQCHNFMEWKSVTVVRFDHSRTRFPLTGLHPKAACEQCHTPGPDQQPRYTGIPFGRCADCHADPHRGKFEQKCESCHTTSGWKKLSSESVNESVDHSKTRFPLLGMHVKVDCVQCHAGGDFKKPLASAKCADCHKDFHEGQFARRAGGGECASCHNVDGFKPSTFGVKEHAATAYPLEGKHTALQCDQCHLPKGKDTVYQLKFAKCADCHGDEHGGQFAGRPYLNACERCHNLQRFRPSTFSLPRHKDTRFQLAGGHVAVACNECHRPSPQFLPRKVAVYRWSALVCTTCHTDPHRGQFEKLMRTASLSGLTGCEVCHSTQSWKEFPRFDHSRTSFPLLGAHKAASCISCHKPKDARLSIASIDFKAAPVQCESCHSDVHGRQFESNRITACSTCHNSTQWKPALFDHDKRTSFPLDGAHRRASCDGCHKLKRTVEGKQVLFYKPTPKECASCHNGGH